jgi:peptide/nickel transport system permease protein
MQAQQKITRRIKTGKRWDNVFIIFILMPLAILFFIYVFAPPETEAMGFVKKMWWAASMFAGLLASLASWEQFSHLLRGTGISVALIGSSLLFALPLSCFVGWWCAERKGRSWLRIGVTVLSAIPVFVTMDWVPNQWGWGILILVALNFGLAWKAAWHRAVLGFSIGVAVLFVPFAIWLPNFSWGVLFLALGNLILANLTRHVYIGMLRELRELYVITAQLKGVAAHTHYWRRLLVILITPVKSQFPYYLSAGVVVEWKLNLYGLGHIAYNAAAKTTPPDLAPIIGVCILTVIIVRLLSRLIESVSERLLPNRQAKFKQALFASQREQRGWIDLARDFTSRLPLFHLPRAFWGDFQRINPAPFTRSVFVSMRSYLRGSVSRKVVFGFTLILLLFISLLFRRATQPLPYRDVETELSALEKRKILSWSDAGRANKKWTVDFGVLWRNDDQKVRSLSPGEGWLFGPDFDGKPVLSELIKGARPYLRPAFFALTLSILLGVLSAAIAGYCQHGWIYAFIQNSVDFLDALPKLVILLALYAQLDLSEYYKNIMPFIGVLFIPDVYYSVKERVTDFRQSEFVEAERSLGAGIFRILFHHIIWKNSMATILIQAAYIMGSIILVDTMLAYLRVNPSNIPTWGSMIVTNYTHLGQRGANIWAYIVPSVVVVLSLTAYNLLGDGLRVLSANKSTESR